MEKSLFEKAQAFGYINGLAIGMYFTTKEEWQRGYDDNKDLIYLDFSRRVQKVKAKDKAEVMAGIAKGYFELAVSEVSKIQAEAQCANAPVVTTTRWETATIKGKEVKIFTNEKGAKIQPILLEYLPMTDGHFTTTKRSFCVYNDDFTKHLYISWQRERAAEVNYYYHLSEMESDFWDKEQKDWFEDVLPFEEQEQWFDKHDLTEKHTNSENQSEDIWMKSCEDMKVSTGEVTVFTRIPMAE